MKEDEFRVLDKYYKLQETIGQGGFGKVKKAIHLLTGERVAIKILDKTALGDDLPRVHREMETLKTLNHPNICKMFQMFETENIIFIVIEYCSGGELFDYIVQKDRLNEDEARRIFRQIAAALAYVHARGVAHRDLKPENILLDTENNVKLIDFGLCAPIKNGVDLETCCGSPSYAAPELIKGQKYNGPLVDVWSLGVILYTLLCGALPFDDSNLGVLYRKIAAGVYKEPRWLSEGSKNILRCMLQVNADFRLPVDQLLRHTWCKEGINDPLPIASLSPFDKISRLDSDILRLMKEYYRCSMIEMEEKILPFNFNSYYVATYLLLLQRKQLIGVKNFRLWGIDKYNVPKFTNRVQKSLESEFLECDSDNIDLIPANRTASMEGGLDNTDLLGLGSPKTKKPDFEDNKENVDSVDFARPKIPSPRKPKISAPGTPTPINSKLPNHLSPARSAECVMTESLRTPVRQSANSPGTMAMASPARRKMLGSLERGLDKVRHMLTPRTGKTKKLRSITTSGKGAHNVSTTGSTDAEMVMTELKSCLARIGMDCVQKGYRLVAKSQTVKVEFEVVYIDDLQVIGIRRKRVAGEGWAYKRTIEEVLTLTGFSQKPNKVPLQTIV